MNPTHQDAAPARKPWWIIIGVLRRPEFCGGITPAVPGRLLVTTGMLHRRIPHIPTWPPTGLDRFIRELCLFISLTGER